MATETEYGRSERQELRCGDRTRERTDAARLFQQSVERKEQAQLRVTQRGNLASHAPLASRKSPQQPCERVPIHFASSEPHGHFFKKTSSLDVDALLFQIRQRAGQRSALVGVVEDVASSDRLSVHGRDVKDVIEALVLRVSFDPVKSRLYAPESATGQPWEATGLRNDPVVDGDRERSVEAGIVQRSLRAINTSLC